MTFETYQKVLADGRTWKCSLLAKGYTSQTHKLAKTDAEEVDICPFLKYGATMYPISMDPLSYFMFDPKEVQGSSKDNILKMQQYIQSICREGGFYASPTHHCVRKPGKKYLALLEFKCEHNKPVLPQDNTVVSVSRRIGTKNPLSEEDKCPFVIRVFSHKHDSYWYLSSLQLHHTCDPCLHKGHHKLLPGDIRTPLLAIDEHEVNLALQCDQVCLSDGLISRLLTLRTAGGNKAVSRKQIDYLLLKNHTTAIFNNYHCRSPAEQLIKQFDEMIEEGKGVNYVALVHSYQESFKIRLPHGRPSLTVDFNGYKNIDAIREAMRVNDSQEVLLAFAWVTSQEIEMLQRFPKLLTMDVTEKTNKEKRGLFMVVGQDGNGLIFTAMHCFMPNSRLESFSWIYSHAGKVLWPESTIKDIECIITDGEPALYQPLENEIGIGNIWSKDIYIYNSMIIVLR